MPYTRSNIWSMRNESRVSRKSRGEYFVEIGDNWNFTRRNSVEECHVTETLFTPSYIFENDPKVRESSVIRMHILDHGDFPG